MEKREITIVSTGIYLPRKAVLSSDLDRRLGLAVGWTEKKTGIRTRYYIEDETASFMGAMAAKTALENGGFTMEDIDCIVSVSGTSEQPIPCNAVLIQRALGWETSKIPCFDINSTCLSFVTGLDTVSYLVSCEKYRRVLFVSSEVASVGVNYEQKESAPLFGDGAAAVVIEKTKANETSKILCSHMETYSAGADFTRIDGGGTKYHPRSYQEATKEKFLFHMNGREVYRLTAKMMPDFIETLLSKAGLTLDDMDLLIPHQASGMAMELIRKKLGIADKEKFLFNIENRGNVIAASIPMALHDAIASEKIRRGDRIMLLGTSAGLSLGGMIIEY